MSTTPEASMSTTPASSMNTIPAALKQNLSDTGGCNIYKNIIRIRNNSFLGIAGYEGIPQNFLLNLAAWLVMVALFAYMRKRVWNYGRIAVMQKEEMEWTDMFYEDHELHIDENNSAVDHVPVVIASAKSIDQNQPTNEAFLSDSYSYGFQVPISPLLALASSPIPVNHNEGSEDDDEDDDEDDEDEDEDDSETRGETHSRSSKRHAVRGSHSRPKIRLQEIRDRGYFSWIKIAFSLTDEQFREKCGHDCVHYLSFQRHLILLVSIITVLSLGIILPINFHQSIQKNKYSGFADTTITNLGNEYNFLWAHVILSNVFLIISVIVMRRFSKRLHFSRKDSCDLSKTVIISGLPKTCCRENYLRTHFEEAYPGAEISEVSFAYNIGKLHGAEHKRLGAVSAKLFYSHLHEWNHQHDANASRPKIRPYLCGIWNCRWCGCEETDAIEYYSEREERYTEQVNLEKERAVKQPLGIAFVTFKSVESAAKVVESSGCLARTVMQPAVSIYSSRLHSNHWSVKYSPPPQEIYWENLAGNIKFWYVKFILVNVLLAGLVVIFTTPVYLFTAFAGPDARLVKYKIPEYDNTTNGTTTKIVYVERITVLVSLVIDTLPSIIVCTLGVTLVAVVSLSDLIIGFWSRTAGIYSEMVKTFFFLTFMVIALPSLGITSFSYFLNSQHSLDWSCIFYKENGALFVNYLITASLITNGADLMRLPELLLFLVKICFAKSRAEIAAIRKSILFEFPIGAFYSWIMLEFAILSCFCVIYPLVTPFGLLYHCLKYWTDRYNIYFAYSPCKVNKAVHRSAISFVMISMFMLQINMIAYVHFNLGSVQETNPQIRSLQIFTLVSFSLNVAIFVAQTCCNVAGDFSPYYHHDQILDFKAEDKQKNGKNHTNNRDIQDLNQVVEHKAQDAVTPMTQGDDEAAMPMVQRDNVKAAAPMVQRDNVKAAAPMVQRDNVKAAAPMVQRDNVKAAAPMVQRDNVIAAAPMVQRDNVKAAAPMVQRDNVKAATPIIQRDNVIAPAPMVQRDNVKAAKPMVQGVIKAAPPQETAAVHHSHAKKPYGRYIPRVLRSEFIRLNNIKLN